MVEHRGEGSNEEVEWRRGGSLIEENGNHCMVERKGMKV